MNSSTRGLTGTRWQAEDFPPRPEHDREEARIFAERVAPMLARTQEARRTQFRALPPTDDAIVFLGDSITEGGLWGEWFPRLDIRNRGISGETTHEIEQRADGVCGARAVFVLAGTNDLGWGRTPQETADSLARIVDLVEAHSPAADIVLQGIMPREAAYAHEVLALNELVRELASRSARRRYVDLWPALAGSDGGLRAELTLDGLHLTGAGYRVWVDVLTPELERIGGADPALASRPADLGSSRWRSN